MNERQNPLKEKSFQFAISIVKNYRSLFDHKKEFVLSKQLLRSGTSVGANIREAQNAESKSDFIHKLSIAQKECDETLYWLELLYLSGYFEIDNYQIIHKEATEILKILRSSILTTRKNNL